MAKARTPRKSGKTGWRSGGTIFDTLKKSLDKSRKLTRAIVGKTKTKKRK